MNKRIKQRKLSNTYIEKYFTTKTTHRSKYLFKPLIRGMPTSQKVTYLFAAMCERYFILIGSTCVNYAKINNSMLRMRGHVSAGIFRCDVLAT